MANYAVVSNGTNTALGAADVLTTLFPRGVEELFMEEFPSYGLFEKKLDYLSESKRELNWQVDSGGGDATTVAEAEANEGPSNHYRPQITRVREYATATVEREDILATRNDKDRIIEVWDLAIKNCLRKIKRSWGIHLFRDGSGIRAYLNGAQTGTTVALASAIDAMLFEAGDWIQSTTLATPRVLASANKVKVIGRSIGAGTLTLSGALTTPTSGGGLVRSGDLYNVVSGIAAWIPKTAPTAGDSFFGVDRSTLGEAAYGHRPTSNSSNLLNIGIDAASYLYQVAGSSPDIWLMNSMDAAAVQKDLTTFERITIPAQGLDKKKAEIGYDAIRIHGPNGKVDIVVDPLCPRGSSWLLVREECQWWTLGPMIDQITMGMGNENGFIKAGVDGLGLRMGGFGNFVITRPWNAAYVALPTA
jgi:hypothetical protein